MAWIESHQALERNPKTLSLRLAMGWDLDQALGKLHRFWWWCLDNAPDGDLRRFGDALLADVVGVPPADASKFIEAMVNAGGQDEDGNVLSGFLERQPYFRVHDWWDYIGEYLKIKLKAHPEKWQRIRDLYISKPTTKDTGIRTGVNGVESAPLPAALPRSPSLPSSPALPETETLTKGSGGCGAPAATPPDPVVLVFKVSGLRTAPRTWDLLQSLVGRFTEAYPAIDVVAECKKAQVWAETNPSRRKTAAGMPAFLSRWLGKAQDRAGGQGGAPRGVELTPDERRVALAYKVAKGKKDDPGWDTLMFPRCKKPAAELLAYMGGDVRLAVDCIEDVNNHFVDTQFDWGWNAVITRAPDFKEGREWKS